MSHFNTNQIVPVGTLQVSSGFPTRFSQVRLPIILVLLFVSLTTTAAAQITDSFDVKVTLDLCPEYGFTNIEIDYKYSIGINPALQPANVLSQQINQQAKTATVELRFPSFFGTIPFKVQAFCRSVRGTGNASNPLSVSNCDALAKLDTDRDGIPNHLEDTNCDNFFSPGDASNPYNVDTDGDGVRDLVEGLQGFDPTNPGDSPRPYIFSSNVFDPDNDNNANAVVWRKTTGFWFVRDFIQAGNHLAFNFGRIGDIPFLYDPPGFPTNVGVIRAIGNNLTWLFRGAGFIDSNNTANPSVNFGIFGDNIILGPWEQPGVTSPALARLFNNSWTFFILRRDKTVRIQNWGGNGDIPKVQDYDGDGLFDVAVFRPGQQTTYIIRSTTGLADVLTFGTGTADHTVRGDYTGDGIDDISFWEPISGLFTTMTSDNGFNPAQAQQKNPAFYRELQLGLFNVHLPLNWNRQNGRLLYTVVDHNAGLRFVRPGNNPASAPTVFQWGLPGDHQG